MRKLLSLLVFSLLLAAAPALAQGSTGLERISFAAGATSAQVSGQVSNAVVRGYAIYAFAGQQMDITLNNATLTVVSPSGIPLIRGNVVSTPVRNFSQILQETGDYLIYVTTGDQTGTLNYNMTVSIVGAISGGTPAAQRIRFALGSTGAVVTGYVTGGNQNSYLLYAFAGQTMALTLDNGTLTVISPSGSPLVRGTVTAQPIRNFSQVLPETGDYTIQVAAPANSAPIGYTLGVSVTGSIGGGSGSSTERINFQPGATDAQVMGQVSDSAPKSYVLGAFAGQTMTVTVNSAFLTVISPTGDPLARAQNGVQTVTHNLTDSGDYSIQVLVPPGTGTVNYALYVSITGTPSRVGSSERISFAPGEVNAKVTGAVSGTISNTFVLYAFAGQTMILTLDNANATLTVVSPSGQPLVRGTVTANPITNVTLVLQETGDYKITVSVPAGTGVTFYTLDVSIPG